MPIAARSAALRQLQKLERSFDRAFAAPGNPWRHLGALGFFLFWVIAASGIYLYIFFDTSVEGAYRSVAALTQVDINNCNGCARASCHRRSSNTRCAAAPMVY